MCWHASLFGPTSGSCASLQTQHRHDKNAGAAHDERTYKAPYTLQHSLARIVCQDNYETARLTPQVSNNNAQIRTHLLQISSATFLCTQRNPEPLHEVVLDQALQS